MLTNNSMQRASCKDNTSRYLTLNDFRGEIVLQPVEDVVLCESVFVDVRPKRVGSDDPHVQLKYSGNECK